jgi:hypothetical protein
MPGIEEKQTKVWICNKCRAIFNTRWLLSRHLQQVHELPSKDANAEAMLSEWWRVYNPNLSRVR